MLKGKDEWPNPMVVTGLPGDFYDEMRSCDKPKNKLIRSTGLVVESRITSLSNVRDLAYRSELSIVVILQVSNQSNCICIKISA